MRKKSNYAFGIFVVILFLALAYFAINYITQDMYTIDFEGYSKYYAGEDLYIKTNIYKQNNNTSGYKTDSNKVSKHFKIYLENSDGKKVKSFKYSGKTEKGKDTEVSVKLPDDLEPGNYKLNVKTGGPFIHKAAYSNVSIEGTTNRNIIISLDKGIYKPGDDVHYRVMALSRKDQTPAADDEINVSIFDGNDNKVYSVDGNATEFGIVSGTFSLADEVNSGNYRIVVECNDQTEEKNFTVNPYITPQFETTITTDKEVYRARDNANISFDAKYFFGEPVVGAKIKYTITNEYGSENGEGITDENGHFDFTYLVLCEKLNVSCEVVDDSNYMVQTSKSITISEGLINVDLIPEFGSIVSGIDNKIYVFAKDTTGKPIKTYNSIKIGDIKRDVITDENGIGELLLTKDDVSKVSQYAENSSSLDALSISGVSDNSYRNKYYSLYAEIESRDMASNQASWVKYISLMKTGNKIVSTDEMIYNEGDDIEVKIRNSDLDTDNTVYVMKDERLIKAVSFDSLETVINLEDTSGIIDLYEKELNNKRTIFIKPAKSLKVDISGEEGEFKPGDTLNLKLTTTDNDGEKIDSNLLISILDNAVLNLAENDLSIDNIKLALKDLKLQDGVSAADVYASAIDNKAPELLMESLVKQETVKPVFTKSMNSYTVEGRIEIGLWITIALLIITAIVVIVMALGKRFGGVSNILLAFCNVIGISIFVYIIIYGIFESSLHYRDGAAVLLASILMGIALYILFLKKYKYFIFDTIYKLVIAPLIVLVPNIIIIAVKTEIAIFAIIAEIVLFILALIVFKKTNRQNAFQALKYFVISLICAAIFYGLQFVYLDNAYYADEFVVAGVGLILFMIFNAILFGKRFKKDGKGTHIENGKLIIDINQNAIALFLFLVLIVLCIGIGMYIYSSTQAQVTNSITNMSTAELEDDYRRPSSSTGGLSYDDISPDATIREGASDNTGAASSSLPNLFNPARSFAGLVKSTDEDNYETEESVEKEAQDTTQKPDTIEKVEKVRNVFLESLAFIPDLIAENGEATKDIQLSDNITTWNIQVVGNSKNGDIGFATSEFKVFKEFFVNYTLPTNAVVTDKVKIPVTVYNYTENDMIVNLNVPAISWGTIGEYTHDVNVAAKSTAMVYVPIEISEAGKNTLRVESKSGSVSDIVEKTCDVKLNGVERNDVASSGIITDDLEQDIIFDNNTINGMKKVKVKLYPSNISVAVENIENMLKMPTGCFEQTSSSLYPDILVLKYLEDNGIKDETTKNKALEYISKGYQKLLTYEVTGTKGGYSLYGSSPAEPVITAFGLMEMKDASEVYGVDDKVIENMKEYLFSVQKSDGTFSIGSTYIGGSARTSNLAMNAYIVWGLSEVCPDDSRINKSVEYLEKHVDDAEDTYTLALMANVFSNTNNKNVNRVLDKITQNNVENYKDYKFIKCDSYDYYGSYGSYQNIQATALTAMALTKEKKNDNLTQDLVDYILCKRDSYGTWGTTQSTILALKAINSALDKSKNSNQKIKVALNDDVKEINVDKNTLSMYEVEFNNVEDENKLKLEIEKGKISYEVIKEYYETYDSAIAKNENKLVVTNSLGPASGKVNDEIIQDVSVENTGSLISNALIKINIPQGCSVVEESLSKLKVLGLIEKYEYNYNTINLYVRNLEKKERVSVEVRYRADYPVEITGGLVNVYDYYNPEVCTITEPRELLITE